MLKIQDGKQVQHVSGLPNTGPRGRLVASVGLGALAIAFGAHAEETAPKAAPDQVQLDELVVTAQKREQRLEDVPAAVTVLNAAQLQRAGARSVTDISLLTPGLNAATGG